MQIPTIAAALVCGLALAACGADEPEAAADREQENRDAMLAYAQCMREQGVDIPDPQFDGGRVLQRGPKLDVPHDKLHEAEEACREHREKLKPPELSEEQQQEMKDMALAHARCMREQGIEDFPDPTFEADGGMHIRVGPGTGLDPEDPDFQKAEEACRDELPRIEEPSQ